MRDNSEEGELDREELHGRIGSRRSPKYPRRTLVRGTTGPWKEERGSIGSQLGKGPIESGMFSDGNDTIPGHVSVQRNSAEKLEEIGPAE